MFHRLGVAGQVRFDVCRRISRFPNRPACGIELSRALGSDAKHQPQPARDSGQFGSAHPPGRLHQLLKIKRHDLRYVGHRVFRQTGDGGWQQDIAGCVDQLEVRRDAQRDRRLYAAAVESVRLDYDNGSAETGLRSDRIAKVSPPDLAAFDYQSEDARMRVWECRMSAGSLLGTFA